MLKPTASLRNPVFFIIIALTVVGCDSGSDSGGNNDEFPVQSDEDNGPPIAPDTTPDPSSPDNIELLRRYQEDTISLLCVPYLNRVIENRDRHDVFNPNSWIGNFRFGNKLYFADNNGRKLPGGPYPQATTKRREFGDFNLLVECEHDTYGTQRLFLPAIGSANGGLASELSRPDWLNYGLTNNNDRNNRGTLFVTLESDLVYQLYSALARAETDVGGSITDSRRDKLLAQAKAQISALNLSTGEVLDSEYINYSSNISEGINDRTRAVQAYSGVMEQFRFLAETTRGIDQDVNTITQELVRQIQGGDGDPNFGDMIAASFFPDAYDVVNQNPDFSERLENWVEYENTLTSDYGSSSSYTFLGADRNTVGLELTSNVPKDGESLQHGIYQEVDISQIDLSSLYLAVSFSLLDGIQETAFFGNYDAAGVASLSMEYLDLDLKTLGATHIANTEDPLFADTGFYNAPTSLQTSVGSVVYRAPSVPNRGLIVNVGDEAKLATGSEFGNVRYLRIYALVGDYIGGDYLRHFLTGILLGTPECNECRAELELHSMELRSLK